MRLGNSFNYYSDRTGSTFDRFKHIDAWTKCLPLADDIFTRILLKKNVLAPNRWQAITWTNDDSVQWRYMAWLNQYIIKKKMFIYQPVKDLAISLISYSFNQHMI